MAQQPESLKTEPWMLSFDGEVEKGSYFLAGGWFQTFGLAGGWLTPRTWCFRFRLFGFSPFQTLEDDPILKIV